MTRPSILAQAACLALITLATPAVSLAQFGAAPPAADAPKTVLTPPIPQSGRTADAGTIWGLVIGVLFAGMVVGVALLPVKRGHQD
jgi:hypothetical protein